MWIRKHKQTQKMEQKMSKLGDSSDSSINASENFVKNNLLKILFLLTEREKRGMTLMTQAMFALSDRCG